MDLWTDQESWKSPGPDEIASVVRNLREGDFAILGSEDEVFMQTMLLPHGYLLEKRDGDADHHYEAVPDDGRRRIEEKPVWWAFWQKPKAIYYFTADEIISAFQAYGIGDANPAFCTWEQIKI